MSKTVHCSTKTLTYACDPMTREEWNAIQAEEEALYDEIISDLGIEDPTEIDGPVIDAEFRYRTQAPFDNEEGKSLSNITKIHRDLAARTKKMITDQAQRDWKQKIAKASEGNRKRGAATKESITEIAVEYAKAKGLDWRPGLSRAPTRIIAHVYGQLKKPDHAGMVSPRSLQTIRRHLNWTK